MRGWTSDKSPARIFRVLASPYSFGFGAISTSIAEIDYGKLSSTERDGRGQLPEPVVLTQEEAEQVAAAGGRLVTGVNGRGCPTCGIGPVYQS